MGVLYAPPLQSGLQKTLDAGLDQGTTASMTLNNTTGVQNLAGVVVVNRIDTDGNELNPSVREFVIYSGTSGATLTGLTRGVGGSTDQDHAVGSVVEFVPDISVFQAIYDALSNLIDPTDIDTYNSAIVTLTGAQTLTNKTLTSPRIGTSINDTNGNEIIETPATASAVNQFIVRNSATGNNPSLEMAGGDSNIGLDLKMKGSGKYRRPTIIQVPVGNSSTNLSVGDGQAFFRVPEELNGMNLTGVAAAVYTAGTTNTLDIQIRNKTQMADMLSTKITIDSAETDSSTAATPPVIDTSNDDVATADVIVIDIDAVHTTPARGLVVQMRFELP